MNKIRILGIAPYESMKTLMLQAAAKRDDIEMTAFTGDLETGVEIASRFSQNNYDFIISRGGTAQLIRQASSIPVVEITISLHDLLRCMQLAQSSSNHYALVGFPNITKNSHFLSTLLNYDMDIFTIHNQKEAEDILQKISQTNYDVILSDSISNSLAKMYDFHSILITSGMESIEQTLDQVVSYGNMYKETLHQCKIFRSLLEAHPFDVYMFTPDGEILYHSRDELYSKKLVDIMSSLVPTILKDGHKKIYRKHEGILAAITGTRKEIDGENLVQFHINLRKVPLSLLKNGLQYLEKEDLLNNRENFYLNAVPRQFIDNLTREADASRLPIFILGERGLDKQHFVEMFYLRGSDQNNPLAIIDCSRLINTKNWDYLMQDMNSPLSDTNTTIYIRNIDLLPEVNFQELLHTIKDTDLHKRNRIFFALPHKDSEVYPNRYLSVKNLLNCVTIEIPPLRATKEYIPHLAGLSIGFFNVESGKEVAGLEPEALRLLQEYDWPSNYTQFKRVIGRLVTQTDNLLIKSQEVREALQVETKEFRLSSSVLPLSSTPQDHLDLHRPLEDITRQIVEIVIQEENGNQSAAARRLGLSRTTLWRILKGS